MKENEQNIKIKRLKYHIFKIIKVQTHYRCPDLLYSHNQAKNNPLCQLDAYNS